MSNAETFKKISESLLTPIEKLYKTGGLGLVFIFIGLLLTVYGFIYSTGKFSVPLFIIGSVLILISFILFIIAQIQGPVKTKRTLKKSAETLDTLQALSIKLVQFTGHVQAYSFKHLDQIETTINTFLPVIKPLLRNRGQEFAGKIENISAGIVDISTKTEQIIQDIEKALKENDFKILKKYEEDLVNLNQQLIEALKI